MSRILPINVRDLVDCRTVESERVEFKASWDPRRTGPQVLRTICAFANDRSNLNGGYVVIGVEEAAGRAAAPLRGLPPDAVDAAQKWIRRHCKQLDPAYMPILSPEVVEGRHILVVWCPGSEMRPHRAPARSGSSKYYVRAGSETVDAEQRGDMLRSLIQLTARVPWDDRPSREARVSDLREAKVREFLRSAGSGLLMESDTAALYRRMRLVAKVNGLEVPRNIALLLFSDDPTEWFRGAWIEVVQFAGERGGNVQDACTFRGGLLDQYRDCMRHLENLTVQYLQKAPDSIRARTWSSFPSDAVREVLANALHHRSYDVDRPDPTKVYLFPDRMEIASYPGPVPGIESKHFLPGASPPPALLARNRRIGEFFKELRLVEQRFSGLPKVFRAMENNGSPAPAFRFDEGRTFFQVTLPAHPEYVTLSALRDAGELRALGEDADALRRLDAAWKARPESEVLTSELVRICVEQGNTRRADQVLATFEAHGTAEALLRVVRRTAGALVGIGKGRQAQRLLERYGSDAFDEAGAAVFSARTVHEPG